MSAKRALSCRPEDQAKELIEGLTKEGLEVHSLPMIKLQRVQDLSPLHQYFEQLETFEWVVFTSVNAVKFFFEAAEEYGLKLYFFPNLKFATVGEKTKLSLEQLGYRTNFVPMHATANVLAENIYDIEEKNVLIPRSKRASNDYVDALNKRGAIVHTVDLYNNISIDYPAESIQKEFANSFEYLIFTSGSTFTALHENLTNASVTLQNEKIICIGPSTANTVEELGYSVHAIAEQHDVDGIISCIKNLEKDV